MRETGGRNNPDNDALLAAAVAARDSAAFFAALERIEEATRAVPLAQLPEVLRMVRVLFYLQLGAEIDGITGFLTQYPEEVGAYTADAERWCRRIGADRVAEYLARAAALFPGGHVPTDFFERADAMSQIDDDEPTPFEQLDREYADAYEQLAAKMRPYLKLRQREVGAALAEAQQIRAQMRTLPAVLEVPDDVEFFVALGDMIKTADSEVTAELSEMPRPMLVVTVLRSLCLLVGADGIWKFLVSDAGDYLHETDAWCRVIGAGRAADYLAETAALFPGGRVPADRDERESLLEQMDEEWMTRHVPGTLPVNFLAALDQKYDGAVDEMASAMRAYLRANATDPESVRKLMDRLADAGK